MPIALSLVSRAVLSALQKGGRSIDGLVIEEGAPPPSFIIDSALSDLEAGRHLLWSSFFFFVEEPGRAIGAGGFRGAPHRGRVEIGYHVAPAYQGQGVATAAAALLVRTAFSQPGVTEVFAESAVDNVASRRVLEKVGFIHIGQRMSADDGLLDQWLMRR